MDNQKIFDPATSDDLSLAFHLAPVGLLVSRQRIIQAGNQALYNMFQYAPQQLISQSLECLYPSHKEFQHIGERALTEMRNTGSYSDERIMRRGGGKLFWCHVSGRALNRNDPFASAVWVFQDMSQSRPVTAEFTPREREISQLLVTGKTSKQIAKELHISHRTVDGHRARLMRKFGVSTFGEMIAKLVGRG
jgi:PAS domain S-box-containing protein